VYTSKIFWLEDLKGRDNSEKPGVDGNIILNLIIRKSGGKFSLYSSGAGYGPVAGSREHCNEFRVP
jgi:hypothetical protein